MSITPDSLDKSITIESSALSITIESLARSIATDSLALFFTQEKDRQLTTITAPNILMFLLFVFMMIGFYFLLFFINPRKRNLRKSEANLSCQRLPIQPQRNDQMLIHYDLDKRNRIWNPLLLSFHHVY